MNSTQQTPTQEQVDQLFATYQELKKETNSVAAKVAANEALDAWAAAKTACDEAARIARNNAGRARVNGFQRGQIY